MSEGAYSEAASERYTVIRELLSRYTPPPARIVDLGAAPGRQAAGLREAGYEVTAVDIGEHSDDWDTATDGTMVSLFDAVGVELVTWNLEVTPFPLPTDTFDAAVMTEVIEHLREYPAESLREVARILKPGGHLYLTTPNAAYILNRMRLLAGMSVATPLHDWIGGVPFARHAREYTFVEMSELLEYAGLTPVEITGRHLYVTSGRGSAIARTGKLLVDIVAKRRPKLGPAIVVVAEKPGDRD